ncbi:putative hydrolase of the metallo-beta-lactamase superfamily [Rubrobacter radiotolerans]|uniref:Ribonuclease J n=1 Tax=Rubrobacter radiotolerans TaxID=42256 RepID=A0A023X2Z4_RUBRA|nr:ribonuclease J [Rubrobacter radiotolerans]AHY46708.1 putative hydrolase of the metallo-beta-lactamase superfamily [Rubrobacter radiotolerans]MDX5894115.1 ribonuclease J [Rubrobacter radiotolerans]SMC05244.1 ribonuclease J [Rubrobacter radiotolerans DSM 5868]
MSDKNALQVVPLGGLGEIGKNMTAVRGSGGIVLVDAGMSFPDEEMPGIDLVLPDFTYLRENAGELRGILLTHGHEDHVGAIPYVLREFNIPVYGTRITLGLVRSKLQEFGIKNADLREVVDGQRVRVGGINAEFIHVNHSIPGATAIALRTNAGLIVFSGDYKIDFTPIEGPPMDLGRFAELGKEGVLAYFGDSTNSERPGYVPSERTVAATLGKVFEEAQGRIIVASFASHLHRVAQVVETAKKHNRLVGLTGRSMVRNVGIARELGYLDIPDQMLVDQKDFSRIPDKDIVILTTGSQGEPLAGLSRIAAGTHRSVEVGEGDTVVIAAHPIPGNEPGVSRTINGLMQRGAEVLYSPLQRVHVSGHAAQEEQKLVLALLKPRYLVPVHGEYRMLKHHAQTAMSMGIPESNIFILENGSRLEFRDGNAKRLKSVSAGMFLVDGGGLADTSESVMRDRQQLSGDGMFIVVAKINSKTGELLGPPDVMSRGFMDQQTQNGTVEGSVEVVTKTLERTAKRNITDWSQLKTEIRRDLSTYLSQKTRKRPMILPLIVEV